MELPIRWIKPAALLSLCTLSLVRGISPCPLNAQAQAQTRAGSDIAPERTELFEKRIRPVLVKECLGCHNDQVSSGGLKITSQASLLTGGSHGPAISSTKPDGSLLLEAIRQTGSLKMPPGKKLDADTIELLSRWVHDQAYWPSSSPAAHTGATASTVHWSFQPVRTVHPPTVHNTEWRRDAVDTFILSRLERQGLRPTAVADRRSLIRRVTYDLTGLPPTPTNVDAFVADRSAGAYEKVVDRLLASPHYGEQFGRHWLDIVRYADTAGENTDHPLPQAWRYRNWVIAAFNNNLPYDKFIRDQVAGDLLAEKAPPQEYAAHVIPTGYLALARRFGHDIDQDFNLTLDDTIDTLGKSVLGLTIGCARCHDHKYDPISSRDYYGLYGIFNSTKFAYPGCEPHQASRDLVPLITPAALEEKRHSVDTEKRRVEAQLATARATETRLGLALRSSAEAASMALTSGEIPDGGAHNFADGDSRLLDHVTVKPGDVVQLSVSPMQNNGADSTLVELTIEEIGGSARHWSTAELVDNLADSNPRPDSYHNPAVWYFLDAQSGYMLLPESVHGIEGHSELTAWRNGDTPSIFSNSSRNEIKVWTRLAPRTFFMHPGPKGPAALAWVCPKSFQGEVRIRGRIADAHPGGPYGVGYRIVHISSAYDHSTSTKTPADRYSEMALIRKESVEATAALTVLTRQTEAQLAYAVSEAKAADVPIQKRGDPNMPGEIVPRKFLDLLGGDRLKDPAKSGRLELADWLTRKSNPLTARVFVNRLWQWNMGQPIVATPNDFGMRGSNPTDPELLDYLASEFMRSGWNIKAMNRRIVLSAGYRQASHADGSAQPASGQNLKTIDIKGVTKSTAIRTAEFPRRRLSAEEIRDTLLSVTGELDLSPGEAHPFPPEASWSFSQHAPFAAEYDTPKRSIYLMQKRNRRVRFFALFDGPDPNASTPVRDLTTVPPQALFFMNDPFVHECARKLANRIIAAAPTNELRLDYACRLLYARPARAGDHEDFNAFLKEFRAGTATGTPDSQINDIWSAYSRILLAGSEFLYLD